MSFIIANIEIPTRTRKATKRGSKYPLADLVAGSGQALVVALEEGDDIEKLQSRLSSAVNTFRQGDKAAKFAIRAIEHEGQPAVAVWRMEDRVLAADEAQAELDVEAEQEDGEADDEANY